MWFLFLFGIVAIGAGIAYRRRSTLIVGAIDVPRGHRVLRLGAAPRHLRQGSGVEPAAAAVLVPHALSARRAGCRRDRALGGTVLRVGVAWSKATRDATAERRRGRRARARRGHGARRRGTGRVREASEGRHLATRLVVIGVVAALFATVALVRINATKGYVTYWAKYNYTGYEGGTAADSDQEGLRRVSSVHRHGRARSRRVACCGSRARRSAGTARRSR